MVPTTNRFVKILVIVAFVYTACLLYKEFTHRCNIVVDKTYNLPLHHLSLDANEHILASVLQIHERFSNHATSSEMEDFVETCVTIDRVITVVISLPTNIQNVHTASSDSSLVQHLYQIALDRIESLCIAKNISNGRNNNRLLEAEKRTLTVCLQEVVLSRFPTIILHHHQ